jgi:hypothetical protein
MTGALFALVLAATPALAADKLDDIAAIAANMKTYDGKDVTVSGKITGATYAVNHYGHSYVRFQLCDAAPTPTCIDAFIWGEQSDVAEGKTITASGHFRIAGTPGPDSNRNELIVESIK